MSKDAINIFKQASFKMKKTSNNVLYLSKRLANFEPISGLYNQKNELNANTQGRIIS